MATVPAPPTAAGEPAWPDDAVEVGRIGGAWGVKGWFRVLPHAADPQALFSSRRWFLQPPEVAARGPRSQGAATAALPAWLRITQAREHGDGVVAAAEQVADRDAAERLKGARVFVSRASFPTPKDDEYYWVDLIGLQVVNREGQGLGTVVDLLDTGPHSVLRVRPAEGDAGAAAPAPGEAKTQTQTHTQTDSDAAERLIPFVAAYVDTVDLAARRITVDWGLDY